MWQIGDVLQAQRKFAEAVSHYEEAKLLMPKDHQNYSALINNMAAALQEWGQYERALALREEFVEIVRQQVGDNHPGYAVSLNNMATLYAKLNRFNLAIEYAAKARVIFEAKLGRDHEYTIGVRHELAAYQRANRDAGYAASLASNSRMCNNPACKKILKVGVDSLMCVLCEKASYCGEVCQKAHWPEHKPSCVRCRVCKKRGVVAERCSSCQNDFCSATCRDQDEEHGKKCGKLCGHCGAKPEKPQQCTGCKRVVYCGREHQTAHWKAHKADCKKV